MISALAARKAAAAGQTSSGNSTTTPTQPSKDNGPEAAPSLKPVSKRKSPTTNSDSQRKKPKTKDATSGKSSKPNSARGKKPTSQRTRPALERYFDQPSRSQEDSFKQQDDVVELDSSDDGESSGLEMDEDDIVAFSVRSTRPRSEASSSGEEEGNETLDIDLIQGTQFSLLAAPSTTGPLPRAPPPPPRLTTYQPTLDENVFQLSKKEISSIGLSALVSSKAGATSLIVLEPHETLCLLGTCSLAVIHGSISLLGATIHPDGRSHRIFAPSSSPLPVIRCAFAKKNKEEKQNALPQSSFSLPQRVTDALEGGVEGVKGAIIALQELSTGVEGLGTVFRPFEGMFAPSKWQKQLASSESEANSPGSDALGVPGLHIVYQQSRDLSPFLLPTSWSESLSETNAIAPSQYDGQQENETPIYLIKGPRNTGKSTFARTLLNKLLSQYERVAFLECDLGQSEFTPCGMVALNVVEREIFGPPFTHLTIPYKAHFIGSSTPRSSPDLYLEAVHSLLDKYREEVRDGRGFVGSRDGEGYDSDDRMDGHDDESDEEDEDEDEPSNGKKIKHTIPLIVNTMGWTKGLGADLTARIEEWAEASSTFTFEAQSDDDAPGERNGITLAASFGAFGGPGGSGMGMMSGGGMGSIQPTQEPTKRLFHLQPPITASVDHWTTQLPLLANPPYEVDLEEANIERVVLVGAGYEDVVREEVGRALNGGIVALVSLDGDGVVDSEGREEVSATRIPNPVTL